METSARVTLEPFETQFSAWMRWPSMEPSALTVTVQEGVASGELECAIEERQDESAARRHFACRASATPGTSIHRIDLARVRQIRLRVASHAPERIEFDIGLWGKAMP